MRGMFITFEGPDGSGKSTQIGLLNNYLKENGFNTVTTREPGAGAVGEKIRELILFSNLDICPQCETLLYAADRAQHVSDVIRPALERGDVVICDRFVDSSIAYQGAGRGLGEDAVMSANALALEGLMPDITFFFDITPKEAFARKGGVDKGDRIETETGGFHDRVYEKFSQLADKYPQRIIRVDVSGTIEETSAIIMNTVSAKLKEWKILE